jgi:hypothetical protein
MRNLEDATSSAVTILATLFGAHNPAAVSELKHGVHEKDTTLSPPFAGKCGDDGKTAWY